VNTGKKINEECVLTQQGEKLTGSDSNILTLEGKEARPPVGDKRNGAVCGGFAGNGNNFQTLIK
jgi:hypothetical protein